MRGPRAERPVGAVDSVFFSGSGPAGPGSSSDCGSSLKSEGGGISARSRFTGSLKLPLPNLLSAEMVLRLLSTSLFPKNESIMPSRIAGGDALGSDPETGEGFPEVFSCPGKSGADFPSGSLVFVVNSSVFKSAANSKLWSLVAGS